ncbi:MAG: DUF4339 domain-containing protein, partial [Pseudomonadota bacterium]
GSSASNAMGMGMGAGMGMQMGNMVMNQGGPGGQTMVTPPAPPPPPVEHVWHIAEGGNVTGPFSKAALGRMVTDGKMSRDSMVWTQGQDGWMKAEDVTELAQLFTVMPPPPPPV